MIRKLIGWKLDGVEREIGGSVDYLRHILRVSFGAFLKFTKVLAFAEYRRTLPADAAAVAGLVSSRDADCGTCVQIGVNMARKQGVSRDVLQAVVEGEPDRLPGTLPTVYRFAEAVVGATGDEEQLRPALVQAYGEAGVIELAYAIAGAQIFPRVKRALGYATSCARVTIDV